MWGLALTKGSWGFNGFLKLTKGSRRFNASKKVENLRYKSDDIFYIHSYLFFYSYQYGKT